MTEARRTALFALAAFLWSVVGVLAGTILGLAAGFEGRPLVFFAALGMAIGWFGFSGSRVSIASLGVEPAKQPKRPSAQPRLVRPERIEPGAARQWLDDFLVKHQGKQGK